MPNEAKPLMPLNGTKTHPLTQHAMNTLRVVGSAPEPRCSCNPGVANRLLRGGLVESVMLPSPFKTHKGKGIEHLRITDAGRAVLAPAGAHSTLITQ